jgi:hypothetical protein
MASKGIGADRACDTDAGEEALRVEKLRVEG